MPSKKPFVQDKSLKACSKCGSRGLLFRVTTCNRFDGTDDFRLLSKIKKIELTCETYNCDGAFYYYPRTGRITVKK